MCWLHEQANINCMFLDPGIDGIRSMLEQWPIQMLPPITMTHSVLCMVEPKSIRPILAYVNVVPA
jgi:hypothetical protein